MSVDLRTTPSHCCPEFVVTAQLPDKSTVKPIPKSIAIRAIAQCSVIFRTDSSSERMCRIGIRKWLRSTTRLLKQEGFNGQEMTAAVSKMMQDALTLVHPKDRAMFALILKTLPVPLVAA